MLPAEHGERIGRLRKVSSRGIVLPMAQKTILVTGGAGFVGSNLVSRLVADGHRVIVVDNFFAGDRTAVIDGADYREGHTKDIEQLVPETPDLIYHLGEYSRVEQSLEEPEVVWDLNVAGTHAMLEYWRTRGCKLVYAGSSTKFGDDGLARHATPYAWTKAANTELVKNYAEWFNLPYAITYFYNVFGPGERSGRYGTVIAWFTEQYKRGEPITVTSPGTQRRNFTHVSDIVEGLVLVGEKGEGDEYGLGNEKSFSMLEVARLFSPNIVMLPERRGNRMSSAIDLTKSRAIGWEPKVNLEDEIYQLTQANPQSGSTAREKRILVFSTTFHPIAGPAEDALCDLMAALPDVHFDVVTSTFSPDAHATVCPVPNATIHRVGFGNKFDKFLLPVMGYRVARELHAKHQYLFAWALMASYAGLAALLLKRATGVPLLITLADQYFENIPLHSRLALSAILKGADQVYASEMRQEKDAVRIGKRERLRHSMGSGDAFANQIRFAYAEFLRERLRRST